MSDILRYLGALLLLFIFLQMGMVLFTALLSSNPVQAAGQNGANTYLVFDPIE